MDNETYEETRLKKDEAWSKYMKEGTEAALLFWNGKVISVDPPVSMELEVTDTDPGLKGNTASGFAPSLAPHDDGRRCHSLEASCPSPPPTPKTCCLLHKCFQCLACSLLGTKQTASSTPLLISHTGLDATLLSELQALRMMWVLFAGGSKPATLETGAIIQVCIHLRCS